MYDDDGLDGLEVGALYALNEHGRDRQTRQLIEALQQRAGNDDEPTPTRVDVHVHTDEDPDDVAVPINFLDFVSADMPDDWDEYIGQDPLKRQIGIHIASAKARHAPLDHVLLASGYPGVGKTTMARLIAKSLGVKIIELVPPFGPHTLVAAAEMLRDRDILFIDEVHKLADTGKRGAEILLKVLEEHVAIIDGQAVPLANITIIGATTDRDKLPEPVVDRFKIKPYFQAYTDTELARIAVSFAYRHKSERYVDKWLAAHIALACRGTPRIIEEMVMAARDMAIAGGRNPTPEELLEFLEVEPDGLNRTHIHYLTAMYQYFARETKDGEVEYIAGENTMMSLLRETKQGIGRVERFLVERGLVDRTTRGRRLTPNGIERAAEFVAAGKGASDVA